MTLAGQAQGTVEDQGAGTPRITLKPHSLPRGEGEAWWWFGALAEIIATSADTGGQFTLVEITVPAGYEGVRHVHHHEDEAFWILEGDITLDVDGTVIRAAAGDYAFGPRDIPHSFNAGADGARMLFLFTPGGFEDLIRDTGQPAPSRTLPPHSDEMPDEDQMKALQLIVAKHGGEILG